MKRLLLFLLGAITWQTAQAQTVNSDCTAPESVQAYYQMGADLLALGEIFNRDLPYKDSILIPQFWRDSMMRPLLAVYHATALPARDTVVTLFPIRKPYSDTLNYVTFAADTAVLWVRNLRDGVFPTGQATIDSLIQQLGLSLYQYEAPVSPWSPMGKFTLISDSNFNTVAATNQIEALPSVYEYQLMYWMDGSQNIADTIYEDRIELTYTYGWGDCPAGCNWSRSWKFIVYPDCSVQYGGSYGDKLDAASITGALPQKDWQIGPNPFQDYLEIKSNVAVTLILSDALGRQVLVQPVQAGVQRLPTSGLKAGFYFYRVTSGTGLAATGKLLRR